MDARKNISMHVKKTLFTYTITDVKINRFTLKNIDLRKQILVCVKNIGLRKKSVCVKHVGLRLCVKIYWLA